MPMKMCWMQAIFVVLWLQCMRTEVLSLWCRSLLHSQCVCWISPCQLQQLLQYCFCQKAWLDTIAAAGCPAVIRSEEKVSTLPNPSFPGLRGAALWVSCRNTCWSPAARAVPEHSAWHTLQSRSSGTQSYKETSVLTQWIQNPKESLFQRTTQHWTIRGLWC